MAFLTLLYAEYHAFAQFTFSATTYSIGTQTELRGGVWYDPVIKTAPALEMDFGGELSLTQASNIDLVIGDGAAGIYRALVDGNILDGTAVTVTLVVRQHWNDASVTETTYTQQLTIVGTAQAAELVTLHLQDLEDQKLAALYPPNTWQASDWSSLSSDDAGKPICEPVGTALKLPCVLLRSDAVNSEYWYGVCTGTAASVGISSINSGTKTITLGSTPIIPLTVGQVIVLNGTSAADGRYTVASAAGTSVTVVQTLPASSGGFIYMMPSPLTVYRNRRVVSTSEYTVQDWIAAAIPFAIAAVIQNGNFATSAHWFPSLVGSGMSVTFTAGNCAIHSVNNSNYAYISQQVMINPIVGGFYAVTVTVAAGSDAVISQTGPPPMTYRLPAGSTTTIFIATDSGFLYLGVWNNAGTANITNVRFAVAAQLTLLKFTQPQIDFNGTPYTIEADVLGVSSRDCCSEIQRLLGKAGLNIDATTFNAAIAQTFAKLVDCDYGRSGQRKFSAILDDLLIIARAGLSRDGNGNYTIWQDVSGSVALTLDESLGDAVKVESLDSPGRPASVSLSFAPSSGDASQMQVSPLTRAVTSGVLGAESPRELRYLRDATTADQLLCYTALRRQYARTGLVTVYRQQLNIGTIVAVTSPQNWVGSRSFTVWGVQRVTSGNRMTLREYNSAVYTYTAATLPAIATAGYQPDYSFTPPAAPTALTITAGSTRVANEGTTTAYITVRATPPTVNWQQLWFAAIHNVTGEITLGVGSSVGGGNYGCTLPQLRPGEVYQLQCYAMNSNSVQGVVQSTFNATAIGGGASVTTATMPGYATAPATVGSITATQAMGKNIRVTWPAVAGTNIGQYSVERSDNGGAYAAVHTGLATTYIDSNILYTHTYAYRVRAQDTYGNFSAAYATSGTISPAGNVSGGSAGDVQSNTIATVNRTGVSTASNSWTLAAASGAMNNQSIVVTHSLGVLPIVGSMVTGAVFMIANVTARTTSAFTINVVNMTMHGTFAVAGALATIAFDNMGSGTTSVDYW